MAARGGSLAVRSTSFKSVEGDGVSLEPRPKKKGASIRRIGRAHEKTVRAGVARTEAEYLDLPMDEDRHVALAYHLLYVVEERAIDEFARAIAAFELAGDHETAAVFAEIKTDEARHLRYCDAIARRYSTDDAEFDRERARMRTIEQATYGAQARGFTLHLLERRLMVLPQPWGAALDTLLFVTNLVGAPAPPALATA